MKEKQLNLFELGGEYDIYSLINDEFCRKSTTKLNINPAKTVSRKNFGKHILPLPTPIPELLL